MQQEENKSNQGPKSAQSLQEKVVEKIESGAKETLKTVIYQDAKGGAVAQGNDEEIKQPTVQSLISPLSDSQLENEERRIQETL